jgi:hypothetical protein
MMMLGGFKQRRLLKTMVLCTSKATKPSYCIGNFTGLNKACLALNTLFERERERVNFVEWNLHCAVRITVD